LSYIRYLDRNALDSRQYRTELWYRVSRTFSVLVMPILALAFVFGSLRSGGTGSRLLIGVVVGLAYYLASEMLANSGQVFDLNPVIVSWLPASALVAVTAVALLRIR
jgi:lipopolysaccharide export system permease protein